MAFGAQFLSSSRPTVFITVEGNRKRKGNIGRLQGWCVFKGNAFLEGSQNNLAPCLHCQGIHKGLIVAPHGDGFFLKESRIQRIIFGVGHMLGSWHIHFFLGSVATNRRDIKSTEKFSQTTTYPHYSPNIFSSGCIWTCRPFATSIFINRKIILFYFYPYYSMRPD